MNEHPTAAIACGPLADDNNCLQTRFQFRPLPTPASVLREVTGLDAMLRLLARKSDEMGLPASGSFLDPSIQPAAAYWMMSRSAWEELGGFDDSFWPAWFEDVDYCRRLQATSWRIYYCPAAGATHVGGVSVPRMGRCAFRRAYYGNLCRYLRKHHPSSLALLWLPIQIGSLARLLVASLRRV